MKTRTSVWSELAFNSSFMASIRRSWNYLILQLQFIKYLYINNKNVLESFILNLYPVHSSYIDI